MITSLISRLDFSKAERTGWSVHYYRTNAAISSKSMAIFCKTLYPRADICCHHLRTDQLTQTGDPSIPRLLVGAVLTTEQRY